MSSSQNLQEGRKSGLEAHSQKQCPKPQFNSSLRRHHCDHWVWNSIPATYTTDTLILGPAGKLLSLETEIVPIKSLKRLQSRPYSFASNSTLMTYGQDSALASGPARLTWDWTFQSGHIFAEMGSQGSVACGLCCFTDITGVTWEPLGPTSTSRSIEPAKNKTDFPMRL